MSIIQNAILIKETGEFLVSANRYDFKEFKFENGKTIFVDGGKDYIRRGGDFEQEGILWEDFSLSSTDTLETIKRKLLWGTRGKDNKGPLRYVRLYDCSTEHLQAILDYPFPDSKPLPTLFKSIIEDILNDRKEKLEE